MTDTPPTPIFTVNRHTVAHVALTTLSVAGAIVFTDARCVCGRRLMAIPGVVTIEVRRCATERDRSGRGRVVSCHRCKALLEIIEHL